MTTEQDALVQLCLRVLPIWGRQLGTSRTQSEAAVSEMLGAFAALGPFLMQASRQSAAIAQALGTTGEREAGVSSGLRGLVVACDLQAEPLLSSLDEQAAAPLRRLLQLIRDTVSTLESVLAPSLLDAELVNAKTEQMYLGFQYQDRANQVMALLQEDMARLHQVLASGQNDAKAFAVDPWLARLESSYAMAEQHHDHADEAHPGAQDSDSAGTSFF